LDDVDRFIEVNKALFALCDEEQAREHIANLAENPTLQALAEALWLVERMERAVKAEATTTHQHTMLRWSLPTIVI